MHSGDRTIDSLTKYTLRLPKVIFANWKGEFKDFRTSRHQSLIPSEPLERRLHKSANWCSSALTWLAVVGPCLRAFSVWFEFFIRSFILNRYMMPPCQKNWPERPQGPQEHFVQPGTIFKPAARRDACDGGETFTQQFYIYTVTIYIHLNTKQFLHICIFFH